MKGSERGSESVLLYQGERITGPTASRWLCAVVETLNVLSDMSCLQGLELLRFASETALFSLSRAACDRALMQVLRSPLGES